MSYSAQPGTNVCIQFPLFSLLVRLHFLSHIFHTSVSLHFVRPESARGPEHSSVSCYWNLPPPLYSKALSPKTHWLWPMNYSNQSRLQDYVQRHETTRHTRQAYLKTNECVSSTDKRRQAVGCRHQKERQAQFNRDGTAKPAAWAPGGHHTQPPMPVARDGHLGASLPPRSLSSLYSLHFL